MHKLFLRYGFIITLMAMFVCNNEKNSIDESDGLSAFSADSLEKHIAELSSDAYTGRNHLPGEK
jgi:hypothetical protein